MSGDPPRVAAENLSGHLPRQTAGSGHATTPPQLVVSPVAGVVVGLEGVPDPVFARGVVGPGTAVDPVRGLGVAVTPVSGTLHKLKAHAFIVVTDAGRAVLVHLGLDTVELEGAGFALLATEGQHVDAGHPVVRWDPTAVEASGRSPVCPVIALDATSGALDQYAEPGVVDAGAPLFRWR